MHFLYNSKKTLGGNMTSNLSMRSIMGHSAIWITVGGVTSLLGGICIDKKELKESKLWIEFGVGAATTFGCTLIITIIKTRNCTKNFMHSVSEYFCPGSKTNPISLTGLKWCCSYLWGGTKKIGKHYFPLLIANLPAAFADSIVEKRAPSQVNLIEVGLGGLISLGGAILETGLDYCLQKELKKHEEMDLNAPLNPSQAESSTPK